MKPEKSIFLIAEDMLPEFRLLVEECGLSSKTEHDDMCVFISRVLDLIETKAKPSSLYRKWMASMFYTKSLGRKQRE